MVVVEESIFQYATAAIFPSLECVDEKRLVWDVYGSEGMVLTGPPVCRSQLVSSQLVNPCVGPNCTNRWPSGEKLSHQVV